MRRIAAAAVAVLFTGTFALLAPATLPGAQEEAWSEPGSDLPKWRDDRIIVRFRDGSAFRSADSLHQSVGASVLQNFPRLGIQTLGSLRGISVEAALERYRRDPRVVFAEPDYYYWLDDLPDDTLFPRQYGLRNVGQFTSYSGDYASGYVGADIDAPSAWDLGADETGVVVAVLDTGVDVDHPDLAGKLWKNSGEIPGNGIDDDGNGWIDDFDGLNSYYGTGDVDDDWGHGTHVTGIIAAAAGNDMGVAGLTRGTRVMPVKIFVRIGDTATTSTSAIVAGLEYVLAMRERGVRVVATNNSWGGGSYSEAIRDAIGDQAGAGILFVAAAGNRKTDNDSSSHYPSSYGLSNIVAVASTDYRDHRSSFSNIGRRTVDVGAPGSNIWSTVPPDNVYSPGDLYIPLSGTSMATPFVTALAAMVSAGNPALPWHGVRSILLSTGDLLDPLRGITLTGKRINAVDALTCRESPLVAGLSPWQPPAPGSTVTLSALSVDCADPVGPVTARLPGGDLLTLFDDGLPPDAFAGDGIFSAAWTGASPGGSITFTSPLGEDRLPIAEEVALDDLHPAFVDNSYTRVLQVKGGTPPFDWSVAGGELPPGMGVFPVTNSWGDVIYWHVLGGTPSGEGEWTFTLKAVDGTGGAYYGTGTISTARRIDLGPMFLPEGNPGRWYSANLLPYHGVPPYLWSISYGTLHQGLSFDAATGEITGVPEGTGGRPLILRLEDSIQPFEENRRELKIVTGPTAVEFFIQDDLEGDDHIGGIAPDGSGGIYAGGTFRDAGHTQCLLLHLAPGGDLIFDKRIEGTGNSIDECRYVMSSGDGGFFAAGSLTDEARESVLFRFDAEGTELWRRKWRGEHSYSYAKDIAFDAAGAVVVALNLPSRMGLMRYLPDGSFDWADTPPPLTAPNTIERPVAVAGHPGGDIFLLGYSKVGFDLTNVVHRYSSSGQLLHTWYYSPPLSLSAADLAVAPDGSLLISGSMGDDAVLISFSTEGDLLWSAVESAAPGSRVRHSTIALSPAGDIFVSGSIYRTDGSLDSEVLLTRYDSSGTRRWSRAWSFTGDDNDAGVALDGGGNIFLGTHSDFGLFDHGAMVVRVIDSGQPADADGDGFPSWQDCDDGNPLAHPAAAETCDGVDNDCDGLSDDDDPDVIGQGTWYFDGDGDSFGNPAVSVEACARPVGYVAGNTDADDGDPSVLGVLPPVFTDSFSDGTSAGDPDWDEVLGGWRVTSTANRFFSSNYRRSNTALVKEASLPGLTAGRIGTRIRLMEPFTTRPNGSIIFGWQSPRLYRYVRLAGGDNGSILIGQRGSYGGETHGVKSKKNTPVSLLRWYRLEMDVFPDGTVTVYLKSRAGATLDSLTYTFPGAIAGTVGLRAAKAKTLFDDFTVEGESALP